MLKRFDGWLILVVLLSLLAVLPLAKNAGLPNGSDVLYHTYRVGEMARSWENGMPFPRWAEGLYYGYGSPLWNFYASFTYYTTTIFVRYVGMSALDALRLFQALCFVLMGTGMYLYTKQQAGKLAGVLAAAAYLFAPYIIYTEPYARGVYPEIYALSLFPWILWRLSGVLRVPSGANIALASVFVYLLAVAHNLMAVTLTIVVLCWLGWNVVAVFLADRPNWRHNLRPYLLVLVCLMLGLGLSGYFWIPVILESGTVNLQNLTGVSLLDYRNFFVSLGALLQPMPLNDLGAINGLRNVSVLGVVQWIGGLTGFLAVLWAIREAWRKGERDHPLLRNGVFFGIVAIVMIAFVTPATGFIWDSVRGLQFLQFPWRLLGPIAFLLAYMVGMNALWIAKLPRMTGGIVGGALLAMIVVFSIPALTVAEWSNTQVDTSIGAYHQSEVAGLQRGTTFTDEYRPRTVYTLPDEVPSLLADYANGGTVNKANVPVGVTATPTLYSPSWLEWLVVTPTDFQMEVYTFYWEGWRAAIDDKPVDITPSLEHGLITFPVPAGSHTVRVYLGSTSSRLGGNILSTISLTILLAIVAIRINVYKRYNPDLPDVAPVPLPIVGVFAAGALALALLNPIGVFYRNSLPSTSPASVTVEYNVGEGVKVIGYDLNGTTFKAGDTVRLVVYWYPTEEATVNYSSFVHIGTLGLPPLAQRDKMHPADRVMKQWWKPTGYLYDEYEIKLPETMPSGEYDVMVGLYTCELMPENACGNGYRPIITDAQGNELGDVLPLASINVEG